MRLFQQRGIYYIEFPKGKRRSLKTRDGRKAKGLFREIEKEYLRGNLIKLDSNTGITLSQFKKFYINDPERADLSPDTHRNDGLVLQNLIEVVGDIRLKNIKKGHIVDFKQTCITKGNKPVTVNSYLGRIHAALNYAVDNDYLNSVPKIKKFKLGQKPPRFIPSEDLEKVLQKAAEKKPEMSRIIRFALNTGARRGEIIKCRYEHIKDDSIMLFGKGNKKRLVPLISYAREVLKPQNIGKIFIYKHVSTLSNYFREITRSAGINSRFHDLRHTAATHMLSKGIPLEVVQKILGHADIRTTQIYADVLQDVLKREMKKLEK